MSLTTIEKLEIERKFDVEPAYVLPDLSGVSGIARVGDPVEQELDAVYYDTEDLRLGRASVTLRRRTGGSDAGWHLKIPADAGARCELHEPLGRAGKSVPKPLVRPVAGLVRRAAIRPTGDLRTRRIITPLIADDGRVLAELADDTVTATVYGTTAGAPATVTAWREIEVELVDGEQTLLDGVGAVLLASGARRSTSASKIARALAGRLANLDGASALAAPCGRPAGSRSGKPVKKPARKRPTGPTAAETLTRALRQQFADLQRADLMVRTDAADGVHQMRVACRRLRSTLAAYRPVLVRERTDSIRDELQWLGAELSAARDAEVSLAHLRKLVDAQPPELLLGAVVARIQQADVQAGLAGRDQAMRALRDSRYLRLLDTLAEVVAAPPLSELAAESAASAHRAALLKAAKRVRRAIRTAGAADDPDRHGHALHEVRKAAKRLRYTAEVAVTDLGKPARRLAHSMKAVQKVLGHRQDTVLTREQCRQLGLQAFAAGENAWSYGRLHALEEARAARAEARFRDEWPSLDRKLRRAVRAV